MAGRYLIYVTYEFEMIEEEGDTEADAIDHGHRIASEVAETLDGFELPGYTVRVRRLSFDGCEN